MPRLTKRTVEAAKPDTKDVILWDATLPAFGLRVKPTGTRSYFVQYRNESGRSRRLTLGRHPVVDAEQARRMALKALSAVREGSDPVEDRQAAARAATVAEFAERYLADYAEGRKKPASIAGDRLMLERFILPVLRGRKVAEVARADVVKLHNSMRATPYQANRVLALMSKMFNLAERWSIREDGTNPCRHVERFKESQRKRYLNGDELMRLATTLAEAEREGTEAPAAVAAIRLLLFTGCRKNEVLKLEWSEVDFEGRCLRLRDSKTGAKVVKLNAPALSVLVSLARGGSPWVVPGHGKKGHLVNIESAWRRIRKAAEIEDVRIHDLRHSYASAAIGAGIDLTVTGKLLGHSQAQTTLRYAHLADDPERAATERVGTALLGMMEGRSAEVVELRKPGA